jgi:hypothetical protein
MPPHRCSSSRHAALAIVTGLELLDWLVDVAALHAAVGSGGDEPEPDNLMVETNNAKLRDH